MRSGLVTLAFLVLALGPSLFDQGAAAAEPSLSAELVDRVANAKKGWAKVETKVAGIELVSSPKGEVRNGEGHLHYKVDEGPVIATTATKLGFHELEPGLHHIEIRLVGNYHRPLGPMQTLDLRIPPDAVDPSH